MSSMPWLSYYGEMPATLHYPENSLYEALSETARAYPHYSALNYLGTVIRYRRLKHDVDAIARGLTSVGIRPGDRICAVLTNTPHAVVLLYAANKIGAVVSFIHPDFGSREVEYVISDLEPRFAVVTDEHLRGMQRLLNSGHIRAIISTRYDDYASASAVRRLMRLRWRNGLGTRGIRSVAAVPTRDGGDGDAIEMPPTFSWASLRGLSSNDESTTDAYYADRTAVISYTGGTSGTPIGVELGDAQLNAQALQTQVQGPVLAGQTILSVAPISHGFGLGVGIHSALVSGAQTVLLPFWTPRSLANTIRRTRPEYLVGVPRMYAMLKDDIRFRRTRLSFLMGAFCGGDRLSAQVRERFDELIRRRGGAVRVREGYGMTETVAACALMPDDMSRPSSVGIPYPDTLIRIARPVVDADSGRGFDWLANGETGEICISGPTVMRGYWRRPSESATALVPDETGTIWLRTGDLGRMDSDGFLYFVQRSGRSGSIDGETVMPGIAEMVLCEQSAVREAIVVVVGHNDEQALEAHVVPVDSDLEEEFLENELRLACASRLGLSLQPRWYCFHEELPATLIGVVDYRRVGV